MVLLILAVVWAAVLVPPMLRSRADGRPSDSISQFRRHLRVLHRTTPHGLAPVGQTIPPVATPYYGAPVTMRAADLSRRRAQERRKVVLVGLLGLMGATLVLGLLPPLRLLLVAHVITDLLFAAYCALLVRMRSVATEREQKLRFLPRQGDFNAEPALVLTRTAVN